MGALEIIIIAAAAGIVIFTVVFNIRRRIKAKQNGGTCGGCSGCAYSKMCKPPEKHEEEQDLK